VTDHTGSADRYQVTGKRGGEFEADFERLFHELYPRIFGHVHRLCGDPDVAADIAQETFVRLHQRQLVPESPVGWLLAVATNLVRNAQTRTARRLELIASHLDHETSDDRDSAVAAEERDRVRQALRRLSERDQHLLSLLAGDYSYREMASALGLHEASVGTLLARARRAFRAAYGAVDDAS
jgi:RNA polymerase sigma-70 factor (ECF subfamily)